MGNRAYITLDNGKRSTYYVHWNGGMDTIMPLLRSLKEIKKETDLIPSVSDIEKAFFEFCGQKMELKKGEYYELSQLIEENGHYLINLSNLTCIHKFEKRNKKTDIYDILSDIYTAESAESDFKDYVLINFNKDYQAAAIAEWPERVKIFSELFFKIMADKIKAEKELDVKLAAKSKQTFKKIILDDLKERELGHIAKKIKSITYKSFSGGDSVRVEAVNLFKKERETLESVLSTYKYGRFNGMTDSYERFENTVKTARKASYVYLDNEFSAEIKEKMKVYLASQGIDNDQKTYEIEKCNLETYIWRQLCRLETEKMGE